MAEPSAKLEMQEKTVGLNIRLAPVDNSDQPVLANFTRLNGAPGIVFVDFGFLENGDGARFFQESAVDLIRMLHAT